METEQGGTNRKVTNGMKSWCDYFHKRTNTLHCDRVTFSCTNFPCN